MDDRPQRQEETLAELRLSRFTGKLACPRCSGSRIQRWGWFSGRRRFRCTTCRRTFSDLTGTPVAYSKKIELLRHYARCLEEGLSIRKTAKCVGISPSTAFRWRHRFMERLGATHTETLSGVIEMTTHRLPLSCKGQRTLGRPARRKGWQPSRRRPPFVAIIIAVDRHGSAASACVRNPQIYTHDLERSFGKYVAGRPVIVAAQGPLGPPSVFARRLGGIFWDARRPDPAQSLIRIAGAQAYTVSLVGWMARFRGVATKYLPNYLAWHRAVSHRTRFALERRVLRWPMSSPLDQQFPKTESRGVWRARHPDRRLGGPGPSSIYRAGCDAGASIESRRALNSFPALHSGSAPRCDTR
jgi:transposase-like protein